MCRTKGHLVAGVPLSLADDRVRVEVVSKTADGKVLLRVQYAAPLLELLEQFGVPPLPPYIHCSAGDAPQRALDAGRYQTVYATRTGAVAAPTAGVHFTPVLFDALERRRRFGLRSPCTWDREPSGPSR